MKKTILFLLLLIITVVSCKKDGIVYSITADAGGQHRAIENTAGVTGNFNANGTASLLKIAGYGVGYRNAERIVLTIDNHPSGKDIVPGTYYDTSSDFTVSCDYVRGIADQYLNDPQTRNKLIGNGTTINHHFKIVITSIGSFITPTQVMGTFSGDAFSYRDLTPLYLTSGIFTARAKP